MINDSKLIFIINTIKEAYSDFGKYDKSSLTDKAAFDLVTSTDFNIENYIISKIKEKYPQDVILSEETNSETVVAQGLKATRTQPRVLVLKRIYRPHLFQRVHKLLNSSTFHVVLLK